MLKLGYFMAKLDLKGAYRSVCIHPDNYRFTGLKWLFNGHSNPTNLVDTRLPFGCRLSPLHFHKLTQCVHCMMARRGWHTLVVYLDDFLIIAPSVEQCMRHLNTLISLVRFLGLAVAWEKIEGPSLKLIFLGVEIDSMQMSLHLLAKK